MNYPVEEKTGMTNCPNCRRKVNFFEDIVDIRQKIGESWDSKSVLIKRGCKFCIKLK